MLILLEAIHDCGTSIAAYIETVEYPMSELQCQFVTMTLDKKQVDIIEWPYKDVKKEIIGILEAVKSGINLARNL